MTLKNPIAGVMLAMLLTGAALIALKLTGIVQWSWWSVTSPIWGIGAGAMAAATAALLMFLLAEDFDESRFATHRPALRQAVRAGFEPAQGTQLRKAWRPNRSRRE